MTRLTRLGVALTLLALFGTGFAQAQVSSTPRALVITAENLMAGDARHEAHAKEGGDATALLPGDVVRYRLRFTNVTDDSVRQVVFHNRMPQGLRFVERSATGDRDDVTIEYSIDGGKSYATQPEITETVEGEEVTRPAPPEMYTHIRWTLSGWLQPDAQVTAEFRARLPDEVGERAQSDGTGRSAGMRSPLAPNPGGKE